MPLLRVLAVLALAAVLAMGCDGLPASEAPPQPSPTAASNPAPGGYTRVLTLAGYGQSGFANLHGREAGFTQPTGLAVLSDRRVVIVDQGNQCLRVMSATGDVTTFAGTMAAGYRDDLRALAAFNAPTEVVAEASGTLYVSDTANHCVRRIVGDYVTTYAGTRVPGHKDGAADKARFRSPRGLGVDARGQVYVGDTLNHMIRVISPDGMVTTLAGTGASGFADGPGASAQFNQPSSLAVDPAGTLYVADRLNYRIRKITTTGQVTTLAGDGTAGYADGAGATARFNGIGGVALASDGQLYVADGENRRIRRVAPDGTVTTVAGDGSYTLAPEWGYTPQSALGTGIKAPTALAMHPDGSLYFTDVHSHLLRKLY